MTISAIDLEEICQTIYRDTQSFCNTLPADCCKSGFKILYGQPLPKPPILFIGYQPGGKEEAKNQSEMIGWPLECEYASKSWALAEKLVCMFGRKYLQKCTGLNAIFVRAQNLRIYRKVVDKKLRLKIEKFCLPRVKQIIREVQPQRLVLIGFETLKLFGDPTEIITSPRGRGRSLIKIGEIEGYKALATLHLSGAHISKSDRDDIRDYILNS